MRWLIEWFIAHENVFVWASLALNLGSMTVFYFAGNPGKVVYFSGAVMLTVGLLMMR